MLQSVSGLGALVLLGDGQADEVGGVDGEADVALGGQVSEGLAPLLLPGETLVEGQLEGAVALGDESVEELLVVYPVGGEMGYPETQRGHAAESCQA